MMPFGFAPQRSKVVPSFRLLSAESKPQVPASRPARDSGAADSAAARCGIAAAAIPISAMNSRLSIA